MLLERELPLVERVLVGFSPVRHVVEGRGDFCAFEGLQKVLGVVVIERVLEVNIVEATLDAFLKLSCLHANIITIC
jgi:hypothetical protein